MSLALCLLNDMDITDANKLQKISFVSHRFDLPSKNLIRSIQQVLKVVLNDFLKKIKRKRKLFGT